MKPKIKDKTKKIVVDEYIRMVKESIEGIKKQNPKMTKDMKKYVEKLEEGIQLECIGVKLGYLKKDD